MTTIIVVILFLTILAVDLFPKWNRTGAKEKFIYCALMLISFGVLVLVTFDVQIPSPTKPITNLIDSIFPKLKK